MKRMNRLIAVLLAVLLAFSCAVAGFAAENQPQPTPADNPIDLSVYAKTALDMPKVKASTAANLVKAVDRAVGIDDALASLLKEKLLNGQTVVDLLAGLVDLISEKLATDPTLAPLASVIKYLFANDIFISGLQQDEKFDGAVQKLAQAKEQGQTTIIDVRDAGVTFTSADFGFEDGDAYGFADALVCSLLDFCKQLGVRTILGDFTDSVKDGAYVAGNYNAFLPVYELLELAPISSVEFTAAVTQAEQAADANDYTRIRTVANLTLKPVADLLTKLEEDGLETLLDCLPKLLYALDSGMVNQLLHALLADKSLFGLLQFNDLLADLDVNTDVIWDLIDEKLVTGTEEAPAGFDFDGDGEKETPLPLTKAQFDALAQQLAYAADPVVKPSVSATEKNRLALETDKALVKQILAEAVVGLMETEEGYAFATAALNGVESGFVRWLAARFLSLFTTEGGRFFLRIL